jgi:hypothetical protein
MELPPSSQRSGRRRFRLAMTLAGAPVARPELLRIHGPGKWPKVTVMRDQPGTINSCLLAA